MSIVMPTKRDKHYVQLFYNVQDAPFICGIDGHFTIDNLGEIQDAIEDTDEYLAEVFHKGAGDYLFQVWHEPEQTGEYGRVEIAAYWGWEEVIFEPMIAGCG